MYPVGHGVLIKRRDLAETLRLFAYFLEDQIHLHLRTDHDAHEVKYRVRQDARVAQRCVTPHPDIFKGVTLLEKRGDNPRYIPAALS